MHDKALQFKINSRSQYIIKIWLGLLCSNPYVRIEPNYEKKKLITSDNKSTVGKYSLSANLI